MKTGCAVTVEAKKERPGSDEFYARSAHTRSISRYMGLLASGFLFINPYYSHSLERWIRFGLFYLTFLVLFIFIPRTSGRTRRVLFVLFFLIVFAYRPFDRAAYFLFIYPSAMLAAFVPRTRTYLLLMSALTACMLFDTWWLHLNLLDCFSAICFSVVFGVSTLAYHQQKRANHLLLEAHNEIAVLAKVAERERISRDLHDLLGHTLTLIAVKAELASKILSLDPQRALQEMVEVEQTARKGVAEVREAVAGYRADGLALEIARARSALASVGIHATASIAPIAFSPDQEHVLCLALREAVTNIVRHAKATRCMIQLESMDAQLRFSVEDNGAGGEVHEGNGLRGMRERVEGVDGNLSIERRTDSGVRVVIDLPRQSSPGLGAPDFNEEAMRA